MTDRELLELAAKAAGIEVWTDVDGNLYTCMQDLLETPWNPLTDDGDAFRLAVKTGIKVEPKDGLVFVYSDNPDATQLDTIVDNAYTATRRAIVLAAAEIGRRME